MQFGLILRRAATDAIFIGHQRQFCLLEKGLDQVPRKLGYLPEEKEYP